MIDEELRALSGRDLSRRFADRSLSPVEVLDTALAVIAAANPSMNALFLVDADGARAAATASQERWSRGAANDPLDGVPTVVKDGLDARGWPLRRGSAARPGHDQISTADAPAVARQREAGMVLLGKSTMCDYGMLPSGTSSAHGVTRNPWDLAANPSGSSSGTAAAIAAGICPLGVGTDIVGSVRHPASFCALVGLKPSQGRVPYMPPGAPSLTAGPMARNLDDLALLLNVITRGDDRDVTALPAEQVDYTAIEPVDLAGLRVGFVPDLGFGLALDDQVERAVRVAVDQIAGAGAQVRVIDPPFAPGSHRPVERFYQARYELELSLLPSGERDASPVVSRWAAAAAARSAVELFADMRAADVLRQQAMALMEDVDFVVMPTVPVLPYPAELPGHDPDDFFLSWSNTFLFNITGQPALSMPCGFSSDGHPIGLQVVGPRFDDVGVMAVGRSVSELMEPIPAWPRPEREPSR